MIIIMTFKVEIVQLMRRISPYKFTILKQSVYNDDYFSLLATFVEALN